MDAAPRSGVPAGGRYRVGGNWTINPLRGADAPAAVWRRVQASALMHRPLDRPGLRSGAATAHNAFMASTGFSMPRRRRVALVAGATGLIGRALIDVLLSDSAVGKVHALVRRKSPELNQRSGLHQHVVDFTSGPGSLPPVEDAYCCLGTTISAAGSKEAFRAVDHDAVLAFARAARAAGATRLCVVSALGADARSGIFYNRVKGEMEAALATLGFPCVVIVRPSLLLGDRAALGQPSRFGERAAMAVAAPVGWMIPKSVRPIAASTVARAMLRAVQMAPDGVHVLVSGQLLELGAA